MATKVRMLKFVQEMRWLAQLTSRRPQPGPIGPLLLQSRSAARRAAVARQKRTIHIAMQDPPDIPNPVKITHRAEQPRPSARV